MSLFVLVTGCFMLWWLLDDPEENPYREWRPEELDEHVWPITSTTKQLGSSDRPGGSFLKKVAPRQWRVFEVLEGRILDVVRHEPVGTIFDEGTHVVARVDETGEFKIFKGLYPAWRWVRGA